MANPSRKAERHPDLLKKEEMARRLARPLNDLAPGLVLFNQKSPERGCFLLHHEHVWENSRWPDFDRLAQEGVSRHRYEPRDKKIDGDPLPVAEVNVAPSRIRSGLSFGIDARSEVTLRPSVDLKWLPMDLTRAIHPGLAYLAERCDPRYECLVVLDPMTMGFGTCVELAQYATLISDADGKRASLQFVEHFLEHERTVPRVNEFDEDGDNKDYEALPEFYVFSTRCARVARRYGIVFPLDECLKHAPEEFDAIRRVSTLAEVRR